MSISLVDIIMGRIYTAHEDSPISVFSLPEKNGYLNAVFGATVTSRYQAKTDPRFVGTFDRSMDMKEVKRLLLDAAR